MSPCIGAMHVRTALAQLQNINNMFIIPHSSCFKPQQTVQILVKAANQLKSISSRVTDAGWKFQTKFRPTVAVSSMGSTACGWSKLLCA